MLNRTLIAAALSLAGAGAFAQTAAPLASPAPTTAATTTQRDVNQQTRIERGLQGGTLTTREAAGLEKQQARIERLQAKDLRDGHLSAPERAQLNRAQDRASARIAADTHNAATGHAASPSSQRLQADVARNVSQQQRIEAGIHDKSLTNREVGSLEHGQARVDRKEYQVARNGHVGAAEQAGVQRAENHQSRRIHHDRTNAATRG